MRELTLPSLLNDLLSFTFGFEKRLDTLRLLSGLATESVSTNKRCLE